MSQKRAASLAIVDFPPPDGPMSAVISPLFCRKRHAVQHSFAFVVRKDDVRELHVVSLGRKFRLPRLHGRVLYLLHTRDIDAAGNDCGEILQCARHRVVHARHHQKIHKECEHIQAPVRKQHRARKCGRRYAEFEKQLRADDKQRRHKFRAYLPLFVAVYLRFKSFEIAEFRICGFEVARGFQTLLNSVRARERRLHLPAFERLLHLSRTRDYHYRNGQHPHRSERHTPIERKERDGNHAGGSYRPRKFGIKVGKRLFDEHTVPHYRSRQVADVAFSEETQRQFAHSFRKRQAAHRTLAVSGKIIAVVLPEVDDVHHRKHGKRAETVEPVIVVRVFVHHIGDKGKQQSDGQHFCEICKRARKTRKQIIFRAPFGKGVAFHYSFQHITPPLQSSTPRK